MDKIVIILIGVTIMSCSPKLYSPNRVNIPGLSAKKDLKVSAAKGYIDFEAQAAYALTNHIGIIGNYATKSHRKAKTNFEVGGGHLLEIGGGYFFKKRSLIFENYATYGTGSFFNRFEFFNMVEDDDGKISADFSKIGLQSSVTLQHDLFSLSAGVRYTNLQYKNIGGKLYYMNQPLAEFLRQNTNYNFIEPALQVGIGYRHIRLNVQYQKSFVLNPCSLYVYNNFNYSAGIQLSFPAIGSKRKTNNTIL